MLNLSLVYNFFIKQLKLFLQIIWEGTKAVGVEYYQNDNLLTNGTVFARGEVILSTGSINTPVLLMQSGVGPSSIIQKLEVNKRFLIYSLNV